jgi:two-component system, LytTR family, response regulator
MRNLQKTDGMAQLRVVIVDDEFHARENLKLILSEYYSNQIECVGEASNGNDALVLAQEIEFDLIFLDIMMPEASGFDFLSRVEKRNFQVVFTTAFREYAIQAIRENALDYLEKPIDIDELGKVIQKAIEIKQKKEPVDAERLTKVLQEIALHSNLEKTIVPTRDGFAILKNTEIVRLEADENYTTIFCTNGKKYVSSRNIKSFEEKLDSKMFMRVHKSHIVNIGFHLKEFNRTEGNLLILSNGDTVPVSRRKLQEFIEKMQE